MTRRQRFFYERELTDEDGTVYTCVNRKMRLALPLPDGSITKHLKMDDFRWFINRDLDDVLNELEWNCALFGRLPQWVQVQLQPELEDRQHRRAKANRGFSDDDSLTDGMGNDDQEAASVGTGAPDQDNDVVLDDASDGGDNPAPALPLPALPNFSPQRQMLAPQPAVSQPVSTSPKPMTKIQPSTTDGGRT